MRTLPPFWKFPSIKKIWKMILWPKAKKQKTNKKPLRCHFIKLIYFLLSTLLTSNIHRFRKVMRWILEKISRIFFPRRSRLGPFLLGWVFPRRRTRFLIGSCVSGSPRWMQPNPTAHVTDATNLFSWVFLGKQWMSVEIFPYKKAQ